MPDGSLGADPFGAFVALATRLGGTGPLARQRLAVKDNIEVEGQPFTAGLPMFVNRRGAHDAPSVRALLEGGADLVGLTTTDAGGFGVLSPTVRNPVHEGFTVGGSSGGAAAAVAAGFADLGLGTDTGGSVRSPATCCGLLGFKLSNGRASNAGIWPLAPSFDALGVMAREYRSLEDAVLLLLGSAPYKLPPRTVMLAYDQARMRSTDTGVRAELERVLSLLAAADIGVEEVELPPREELAQAHAIVVLAEAREIYDTAWSTAPSEFPNAAYRALRAAERLSVSEIANARAICARASEVFAEVAAKVDGIVLPTLRCLPPAAGATTIDIDGVATRCDPGHDVRDLYRECHRRAGTVHALRHLQWGSVRRA